MTKQPRLGSKMQVSKLCRLILLIGLVKLSLLIGLAFIPNGENDEFLEGINAIAANNPFSSSENSFPKTSSELNVPPPAPVVKEAEPSPFAQGLTTQNRPDHAINHEAPIPTVTPILPKDSASRKQDELNRREQELLALQQQMESRLDELKQIEGRVETMLKEAGTNQDDKLRHLVDVYSNMKAKQAAQVLTSLDERIAVSILAGMRGRQAGEILTYMNAEKAAKLSEALTRTQLPK